jgi:hypothetical protein
MRVKLNWIELLVILSLAGFLLGLLLPGGDFDLKHRFLREDLQLGRITAVSALGLAKVGRAAVNLGAKEGLHEGDVLTVQRRGRDLNKRPKVVSVTDHSCVVDEGFPGASEHPLELGLAVVAIKVKDERPAETCRRSTTRNRDAEANAGRSRAVSTRG